MSRQEVRFWPTERAYRALGVSPPSAEVWAVFGAGDELLGLFSSREAAREAASGRVGAYVVSEAVHASVEAQRAWGRREVAASWED